MKKLFYIAFASLVMLATAGCSTKYETVQGDPLGTKMYTLDNGLKVYMSVNKERPRIQTYIAVKVGSKNDPSETTGLAHYFEHLMFKGTEQFGTTDYAAEKPMLDQIEQLFEVYRTKTDEAERAAIYHQIDSISYEASKLAIPNEYDKLMAIIGARETNAWTSDDETVYTEDIPSNQIDNWARIQADRFRHNVIRGFHTELETIYEEKNMSLTQDNQKIWEGMAQALYPHHPYGKQTTLGSQEHLKNPSITNVKKYHDQFYVPNNIAICVSGDFDPDEMVAAIEKYFGDWEPNPAIPQLQYEKEAPITTPIVKEVYGLESEMLVLGWRTPGAYELQDNAVADIARAILSNGQAGLMDLDINQQQKALGVSAGNEVQPDYSSFVAMGRPKEGQTLEELRDLLLGEVAKLRDGDFDETLIKAAVNNIKLNEMRALESNQQRAQKYVDAFINGIDWKDACKDIQRYEAVTKDDVVAWANEYLQDNNYAVVYKRRGIDTSVQKISAPKITPIVTNRDLQSDFLKEIASTQVKPIEPVFVDFSKDMSTADITPGVNLLYKHNDINGIFNLSYTYNMGAENDPGLSTAVDYLSYLGTESKSAEEIALQMYTLGCDYQIGVGNNQTTVSISGLSENMAEAMKIVEDLMANAKPDDAVLENLKDDVIKSRADAKRNQRSCVSALQRYVFYGSDFISRTTLSNEAVAVLSSDVLLERIKYLFAQGHEIAYYGPMNEAEVKAAIAENHVIAEGAQALPESHAVQLTTPENKVIMAQYDAKQLYYYQYSNMGEAFDPAARASINMYNEYFGSGMNGIVFQEMREARGLAYSASARLIEPRYADASYYFLAFIATQNDKMKTAIEAFDDIINNMPESEAAFNIAKEGLISRMRTGRTIGMGVLEAYRNCRRLGLSEPLDKEVFEKVQNMTLEDVKATQEKWITGRKYNYMILGDIADLDMKYLKTLGPVKVVSLSDIFGY